VEGESSGEPPPPNIRTDGEESLRLGGSLALHEGKVAQSTIA